MLLPNIFVVVRKPLVELPCTVGKTHNMTFQYVSKTWMNIGPLLSISPPPTTVQSDINLKGQTRVVQ